jgi:hypothetical protein
MSLSMATVLGRRNCQIALTSIAFLYVCLAAIGGIKTLECVKILVLGNSKPNMRNLQKTAVTANSTHKKYWQKKLRSRQV